MINEAIKVDNITKVYGNTSVVDSLSFTVKKGSIHGFLGPNGAGKTTTMKMIAGVIPPQSGKIFINGQNVQENLISIKKKLGVLLEVPPLYKEMEVYDYLKFVCQLHEVPKHLLSQYIDLAIEKLELGNVKYRLIGNLSKGYKQRVGVAQAIVFQPEIVILDEPTVGLDPSSVIEMRELIKALRANHTVLLSSHLLHEIGLICDEVTIINNGRVQASGPLDQIATKLKEKDCIYLEVKDWSPEVETKLKDQDFISFLDVAHFAQQTKVKIHLNTLEDKRTWVSQFVFENNLGLIELYKEELDLEKIFLEVTGGQQ